MESPVESSNISEPSWSETVPVEHDEELLGVAVGVRLVAGRPPCVELADDDLQVLERLSA